MPYARVQLAWKSQAGHRHQVEGGENEDAVFVTEQHPLFDAVLMVADGMGGHPRAREASEVAVQAARTVLFDPACLRESRGVGPLLVAAIRAAHKQVGLLWKRTPKRPGTTLSMVVIVEQMLYVAHVGDGSVYLVRGGRSLTVAGGEDRRAGNRPAQYLGQELPLEIEEERLEVAKGDRILLCTDGLTRYFNGAGSDLLDRVVGRRDVELGSVASQLVAHARPGEYDDDTTVALAEITALLPGDRPRPAAAPEPAAPSPIREPIARVQAVSEPEEDVRYVKQSSHNGASPLSVILGLVVGGALVAGGFLAGRWTAPTPTPSAKAGPGDAARTPASAAELAKLPTGNLILMDELGQRVFTLPTRGALPGTEPLKLRAFQVGRGGRFVDAGEFRLDPAKGELADADGNQYPVDLDYSRGTIRVLRGGALAIQSRTSGAQVRVDGREVGTAPQKLALPEGKHHVRVAGRSWVREGDVDVVPGGTVTWSVGP